MSSQAELPVPLNVYEKHWRLFVDDASIKEPATLPVQNPTRSFWLHPTSENPLAKEGSQGALSKDADICIIGSGITGISAAYHLAKAVAGGSGGTNPLKVVILEARDFCSGATGRNGGHLTPAGFLDFGMRKKVMGSKEALKQYALEAHSVREITEIIKANDLEEKVDLVSGGHFDLIFTEDELTEAKSDFEAAKAAGADLDYVRWFSRDEMIETFGTKYPAAKIHGHNLWPMKYVTQLYYLAQKSFETAHGSSLRLHTNTPVTSIKSSDDKKRRWSLQTPRGSVSCNIVLHATNGYASHLLPFLAGPNGIIPTRGQIIATRAAVSVDSLSRASWSGNEGFEYWFPRPTTSSENPLVILGGGREIEKDFELNETDDSIVNKQASKVLRAFLPAVFPGKFDKKDAPEMEWTGIMGFTKLTDPFVGPVVDLNSNASGKTSYLGQYISAGYTGHGMPRTYACAEAVVSLILHEMGGGTRDDWVRPDWLPARYLTWVREAADKGAQGA
ncbi:DAO-domain-containing protein [Schizopora paradoxa]|uniref:DAO-domain-containing protein n=1 Tax=Schizopora paradoxa TaxID=27342 RepID=A0A0H2S787_9AGAM|nr:DAO-domain-containing protein [Schizopora paradoxa]